jgi:ADP-ribose pyrophosphatase YjhB (NUDIX family)
LSRYNVLFCPNCATPVVSRLLFGRERKTCPSCGWIHFEDPKVAAGVLVEQDGQVLLVKRLNHPRQGFWSIPAGFVDAGEDPARAAERECLEETGLQARVTRLLEVVAGREHEDGADFVIVYAASIAGGSLQAGDDAGEAAFFPRSALPPLAFRATEVVLKLPD